MKKPRQLIIIGGGTSMKEGISKYLWKKLQHKFTIGINYSYHYFDSTCQVWLDKKFYDENKEDLKKLPLIVTKPHQSLPPNVVVLKATSQYHRNVKLGCYKGSLSGIFALSLGIHLLDEGDIFLLGYDYGETKRPQRGKDGKPLTHFYQGEIKHRGVGKINYYNTKDRAKRDFGVFANEKKIKIYNVSMNSKINIFPKITYDEFFKKLDNETYCQPCLHKYIKEKLKC